MPYRDDYDALVNRNAQLNRELAEARATLEHERRVRSLPLLDQIRVASPCNADWDTMKGDHQVRFCGQCQKNVYNLSGMARAHAERLVQETEGRLCVRFYRRADGTLLTADCPVGASKLRFRRATVAAVGAGLLLVGGFWASRTRMGEPVPSMGTAPRPALMETRGEVASTVGSTVAPPAQQRPKPAPKPHPTMGHPKKGQVTLPQPKSPN
jgi:hypothetical protein